MQRGERGTLVAEGKTMRVYASVGEPGVGYFEAKDDITAGDGAKHHVIEGKGALSTETTCNVFSLLERDGFPLAYLERVNDVTFKARMCAMLPLEVVVRRVARGSYLKRHRDAEPGSRFLRLKTEFFLKTAGKRWRGNQLPVDDPLILFRGDRAFKSERIELFLPSVPLEEQTPMLTLPRASAEASLRAAFEYEHDMRIIAERAFRVLERAWQRIGGELEDFKVEFGCTSDDELVLADVINNDSWRVRYEGRDVSKQNYREGAPLEDVLRDYQLVAKLSRSFLK